MKFGRLEFYWSDTMFQAEKTACDCVFISVFFIGIIFIAKSCRYPVDFLDGA